MLGQPSQAGSQSAEQKPIVESQSQGHVVFQMPKVASRQPMARSQE